MQMLATFPRPLDDVALAATWKDAWSSLGPRVPVDLSAELMTAWSEPHRHYHDQRHLRECLAFWGHWRDQCDHPGEVAIALWFHDAILDLQSSGNEIKSAAWAARSLVAAGVGSDSAQRVYDLVVATRHDAQASQVWSPDAQLVLDIDLSILGSPADRFDRYDQDVRKEYAWLPGFRYQAGRARVLQHFLDRTKIYHGEEARALLESQARTNLAGALSRLSQ